MDIYASLQVYLSNSGDWSLLLRRAFDIQAKEILIYGLFYVNFFYGKGTVPTEVMNRLLSEQEIKVPILGNTSIPVDCIDELLKSEVRITTSIISPDLWMLHPKNTSEIFSNGLEKWKAQGNTGPFARCLRVEEDFIVDGNPDDNTWKSAEKILIDQKNINPNQFFLTHVIGGVWPDQGGVNAYLQLFWNNLDLFIKINVSASDIQYVSQNHTNSYYGERVVVYISDRLNIHIPPRRIELSIGQESHFTFYPKSNILYSSVIEIPCQIVNTENINASVYTSRDAYRVDLKIPWKALNILPHCGLNLGFDAEVLHMSPQVLKTAIAWSGGGFLGGGYKELYGTVMLDE